MSALDCGCDIRPDFNELCEVGKDLWYHYVQELFHFPAVDLLKRAPRSYRLASRALDIHWQGEA